MTEPQLDERVRAIKAITDLYRPERLAYLAICVASALILLVSAVFLIVSSQAAPATLTLLFGSSGVIGFTILRIIRMWERSVSLVLEQQITGGGQ